MSVLGIRLFMGEVISDEGWIGVSSCFLSEVSSSVPVCQTMHHGWKAPRDEAVLLEGRLSWKVSKLLV